MTEQEIINILKENKTKGVAYLFMPEEVSEWVWKHLAEPKLLYLNPRGDWKEFNARYLDDYSYENVIFALPDDYKVKEEGRLVGISCHYTGGDEVEIDIGKRELTKLAEYIMCVAQEGRHDPELDVIFSIIVNGARISRCKLPSDVFKAFKKFMKNKRHTEV